MKKTLLILITLVILLLATKMRAGLTFQVVDTSTLTTNSLTNTLTAFVMTNANVYSNSVLVITNAVVSGPAQSVKTNNIQKGDSLPGAFAKINGNFALLTSVVKTNGATANGQIPYKTNDATGYYWAAPSGGTGSGLTAAQSNLLYSAINTNLAGLSATGSNVIASLAGSIASNAIPLLNGTGTNTSLHNAITISFSKTHAYDPSNELDVLSMSSERNSGGAAKGGVNIGFNNGQIYGEWWTATLGGSSNDISQNVEGSAIFGGNNNYINSHINLGHADYSTIVGGRNNLIDSSTTFANNSFACGVSNNISGNSGVWAWNDGTAGTFTSAKDFTFLIHSSNGVAININDPGTNALKVSGNVDSTFGFSVNGVPLSGGNPPFDPGNLITNIYGGLESVLGISVRSANSTVDSYPSIDDTAFGFSHASGSYAFAAGQSSASAGYATALGVSIASGGGSVSIGYGNTASGLHSTALGNTARALHDETFVWSDGTPIPDSGGAPYASLTNNTFNAYAANGFNFDGGPVMLNGVAINSPNGIGSSYQRTFSKLFARNGTGFETNYNGIWTNNYNGEFVNVSSGYKLLMPGTYNIGPGAVSSNLLGYLMVTNDATMVFGATNYPGSYSPTLIGDYTFAGQPTISVSIYDPQPLTISQRSTTATITNGATVGTWVFSLQLVSAETGTPAFRIQRPGRGTNTLTPLGFLAVATTTNLWSLPVNPNTINSITDVSGTGASVTVVDSQIEQ
jgi:hypothetical protein